MRQLRIGATLILTVVAIGSAATNVAGQRNESPEEKNARLARQGAGLRAGLWKVTDLAAGDETALLVEGFFQKGIDLHLAMESSIAVWRNQQTVSRSTPLGGTTTDEITTYLVPLLTSIKFFPTRPGSKVEPFLIAGAGFAIGIGESAGAGGLLSSGSGTQAITGFGAKAGGGIDFSLGPAFALTASARYQWIKLQDNLGSDDTFKGIGVEGGLRYRFQY